MLLRSETTRWTGKPRPDRDVTGGGQRLPAAAQRRSGVPVEIAAQADGAGKLGMTRNAESFKFFTSGSGCFQHGGEPVSDCGCCVLLGGSAGVRRSFDKSRIGLLIHFSSVRFAV